MVNWKIVAVVLVIIAAAYYFFYIQKLPTSGQQPASGVTFDSAFAYLENVRVSQGIEFKPSDESLLTYSDAKLEQLKTSLRSFKSQTGSKTFSNSEDQQAILDLADIHIAYADILRARRKTVEANNALPSLIESDACSDLSLYESLHQTTTDLIGLALSFNAQLQSYDEKYPIQSINASTSLYYSDEPILESTLEQSQNALNDLRDSCG